MCNFYPLKKIHIHAVKQNRELEIKNMNYIECNHEKYKFLCCCLISKIDCVYGTLQVLGYRQIKNFKK